MASFVRQLNMYDFHKVMNVEAGGLRGERDEVEFAHPYFERGQDHLLDQIKRKVSLQTRGAHQIVPVNTEKVTEVLSDVSVLKNRQEDLDEKLHHMRNENSELWREVENLRHKHEKQQRIVNKLIQFLGAMVQGQSPNGIGMKRKLKPSLSMIGSMLALEADDECSAQKEPKIEFPADEPEQHEPIIQEVTDDIVPASAITTQHMKNIKNTRVMSNLNTYVEPESRFTYKIFYCSLTYFLISVPKHQQQPTFPVPVAPAPIIVPTVPVPVVPAGPAPVYTETFVTPTKRPVLQRQITKEDFDLDVNNMQADLESLKDILSGQISIDASMVSSLFDAENEAIPTL